MLCDISKGAPIGAVLQVALNHYCDTYHNPVIMNEVHEAAMERNGILEPCPPARHFVKHRFDKSL